MYREQFTGGPEAEADVAASSDKVLIVVPCLNERAHIGELIAQLCADTAQLDRQNVVVDGGSTDGTQSLLAEIAAREVVVTVIANPKKFQSAGVNLAVRAFGDGRRWLARIDAHASYPAGYVSTLIAEARRTNAASVVVAMRSHGTQGFQQAVALVQNSAIGAGGAAHRRSGKARFVDHGHHALFDLKRFVEVGGYDENVSHNEDAEFDVRLVCAGGKIWLTRAVDVTYFPRSSVKALFRQYRNYGRGRAATILRHRKLPKLRQVLPAGVVPAWAALLFLPWIAIACAPLLCWSALCLLYGAKLGMRFGPRAAIFAGLAAMTIHLGWSIGFWLELLTGSRRARDDDGGRFAAVLNAGDAAS
ncbi:MAG TPA: glycosyltransferase family 2 protein [Stellaceae bacterium]|jgi:succinoglycan biosynthesis protein ExoA